MLTICASNIEHFQTLLFNVHGREYNLPFYPGHDPRMLFAQAFKLWPCVNEEIFGFFLLVSHDDEIETSSLAARNF